MLTDVRRDFSQGSDRWGCRRRTGSSVSATRRFYYPAMPFTHHREFRRWQEDKGKRSENREWDDTDIRCTQPLGAQALSRALGAKDGRQ